jgi:hypothetical protein
MHLSPAFNYTLLTLFRSVSCIFARVSSTAEGAVRRAADSASNLVLTLKDAQLGVMDSAPKDVKDTQWFKDFRRSVTDLESTGELASRHYFTR